MSRDRGLRQSQVITPHGVGAILDIGKESFVVADISFWKLDKSVRTLELKRLSKLLGKQLKTPPKKSPNKYGNHDGRKGIQLHRFPRVLFCASCRRIRFWKTTMEEGEEPKCRDCSSKRPLVPMRFVMACENGHLSDVPWSFWAHSQAKNENQQQCRQQQNPECLNIRTHEGGTAGLESLYVECDRCKATRTLSGITARDALRHLGVPCNGTQPWEFGRPNSDACEAQPRVLQRGASNVYYPLQASALDVPVEGDEIPDGSDISIDTLIHEDRWLDLLKELNNSTGDILTPIAEYLLKRLAKSYGTTRDRLLELAQGDSTPDTVGEGEVSWSEERILLEEWTVLTGGHRHSRSDEKSNFIAEDVVLKEMTDSPLLISQLDRLVLIRRLREVRAHRGFYRVAPGEKEQIQHPDLGKGLNWLPAIEVFGEGIFLSLKESSLVKWEKKLGRDVQTEMEELAQRKNDRNFWFLPDPSPRLLLLHTLAHILIRQLVFESGYSSSSIRERIYASRHSEEVAMAGILIYTADSDSEGSLGGLVRQGERDRFVPTLVKAIERALWCAADPICSETQGQGLGGLNRAACHACTLLPETSCVLSNTLLDRGFLYGRESPNILGFFQRALEN